MEEKVPNIVSEFGLGSNLKTSIPHLYLLIMNTPSISQVINLSQIMVDIFLQREIRVEFVPVLRCEIHIKNENYGCNESETLYMRII